MPYEFEVYQEWHKRRLGALPGITDCGKCAAATGSALTEMVRMDLEYIERQSFWLDLGILLRTPWAVISSRGAVRFCHKPHPTLKGKT